MHMSKTYCMYLYVARNCMKNSQDFERKVSLLYKFTPVSNGKLPERKNLKIQFYSITYLRRVYHRPTNTHTFT